MRSKADDAETKVAIRLRAPEGETKIINLHHMEFLRVVLGDRRITYIVGK